MGQGSSESVCNFTAFLQQAAPNSQRSGALGPWEPLAAGRDAAQTQAAAPHFGFHELSVSLR